MCNQFCDLVLIATNEENLASWKYVVANRINNFLSLKTACGYLQQYTLKFDYIFFFLNIGVAFLLILNQNH